MFRNLITMVLIFYAVLLLFAYIFSEKLIFPRPESSYRDTKDILKIVTADGKPISALYLQNSEAKYTILFSHGNYEDIGTIRPLLENFRRRGFSIFGYDYHGYGTSEGKPSEKNAYYDIDAAYDYLTNNLKIKPEQIIVFGFSVGTGSAIDLAARKKVAAVIVQSPFLSAYRAVTQILLLPFDKFDNLSKIKNIKVPILIIHGNQDTVIPFWQGRRLYDFANYPKYYYWVDGAGHNDLIDSAGSMYWQKIKDFEAKIY